MAIIVPSNFNDQRLIVNPIVGGDADDLSEYNASATLVASPTVTSSGIVLNGTDQYITYPDVAHNSLFSANQLTLGIWFNADTVDATDQILIAKNDGGDSNKSYKLFIDATTDVIQSVLSSDGSADSSDISSTGTITAGSDTFVVMTWDGTFHKIYIDGVEDGSGFYSSGVFDSNETVSIGADFSTGTAQLFLDGTVNQTFILGTVLQPHQIEALNLLGKNFRHNIEDKQLLFYENFSAGKIPNDWQLISGQFAVEFDSSLGEYYLACVSAGAIGIPIPEIMQDMTLTGLEFEWKMWKDLDASTSNVSFTATSLAVVPTGYRIVFDSSEAIALNETGVADLGKSANSTITIQTWHTVKVQRSQDTAGQYEMFLDDVSVTATTGSNPIVDTTTTNTKYWVADLDVGDRIRGLTIIRF